MQLSTPARRLIYLLFFLSGFSALIYEVLWTKYLTLSFGATMIAVSIVAATFMGGLAIGSYLLGRFADHDHNLLRLYALLEGGIALFALLFPPTIAFASRIHIFVEQLTPNHPLIIQSIHLIFAVILLLPPTICMGGTFPIMCRFFARKKSGGQIGRLYALNTLGATAGTFLAGFLFIPFFGLSKTGYLAAALNISIAIVALILSRKSVTQGTGISTSSTIRVSSITITQYRIPLLAIGLVGFLSLAYEILWTRLFLLFLGNTTYSFALILSAFLIGIALGGAIYARKVFPELDEKRVYVHLTAMMGLSILVTVPFYDRLALVFQKLHELCGENWWGLSFASLAVVFAIVGLPTILSGSLLPATIAILDPGRDKTGEGVGMAVLFNTLGAVLGSITAVFLLIPGLGLRYSFILLAIITLILATGLAWHFFRGSRLQYAIPLLTVSLILLTTPFSWNEKLMNSGVYIYALKYAKMGGIQSVLGKEKVIETIEGTDATVAIHETLDGVFRFFTVNGKTDGGNGQDMATQVMIGQLPLLLHPAPEEVMLIGLGTGITLRGMSAHPTKQIDCVEISREVVKASAWFSDTNGKALQDPKVNLLIGDGRNQLLTSEKMYDVIISEPSNPWQTGNANLFTADFYNLAAQRLKPGGLFGQWIGLYDITPENLKILCNTFLQSFPRVMAFTVGADMILIGGQDPLHFNYLDLRQRFAQPEISATLNRIGITSLGDLLARHYLYSEEQIRILATGTAINSDDMPILEYSARYNLGEKTLGAFQEANISNLLTLKKKIPLPLVNLGRNNPEIAESLHDLSAGYIRAGLHSEADYLIKIAAGLNNPPKNGYRN